MSASHSQAPRPKSVALAMPQAAPPDPLFVLKASFSWPRRCPGGSPARARSRSSSSSSIRKETPTGARFFVHLPSRGVERTAARMSKRFKFAGQTCVYCGLLPATSADHVFSRQFFLVERRDNLPKVPACDRCNNLKGTLER
jgi:hypothetical protein